MWKNKAETLFFSEQQWRHDRLSWSLRRSNNHPEEIQI